MKEVRQAYTGTGGIAVEAFIILLAFLSVLLFVFEFTRELTVAQQAIIRSTDFAVALVFLTDFLVRFAQSTEKVRFVRRYWWQLLAAIPVTEAGTQAFRALMLLRILGMGARATILLRVSRQFVRETFLASILLFIIFLIFTSTVLFYLVEADANPQVATVTDSLWWTVSTMTTTGVGNIDPVTGIGRVIGIFLMLGGVSTIGVFTASVASYLIRKRRSISD